MHSPQITFVGASTIGDVPALEATDYSGDDGNCSSWSVVTGYSNGTDVTAATTQQSVSISTQVGPAASCVYRVLRRPAVPCGARGHLFSLRDDGMFNVGVGA